jgi:hypothetical protein
MNPGQTFPIHCSNGTGKGVPVLLTEHHAMKTYWRSGGIAPRILDLGTRWRWVVSFTPWPIYPQGKKPWYPLDRRLGGPQSRLDAAVKRQIPDHLVRSSALYNWAIPAPVALTPILILSSHLRLGLPSGLFPSSLPTIILCQYLNSPMLAPCPTYHTLLDLITTRVGIFISQ